MVGAGNWEATGGVAGTDPDLSRGGVFLSGPVLVIFTSVSDLVLTRLPKLVGGLIVSAAA